MSTTIQVKKALSALLRDPGNSNCADCKIQSHPRWASWSLGVFICIKCAGVHRSLGTHISKVKSVDLDTWKEEHLEMLIKMKNNNIANDYYENSLPGSSDLRNGITDTNKLILFIKNKYEYKKWIGTNLHLAKHETSESLPSSGDSSNSLLDIGINTDAVGNNNNNDHNNKTAHISHERPHPKSASGSLLNLQTSSDKFKSTRTKDTHRNISRIQSNPTRERAQPEIVQRPDLKKSILSLYSKPASNSQSQSQSTFFNNNNNNNVTSASTPALGSTFPSANANIINNTNNNSTFNMNMNMNFSTNSNNNNDRNSSNISLEDNDLFKNVWT
ncbi:GTPase-activating protein AGE2 NDAI_0A02630 [Naumovozyma dairenensis CBS 421]|uniref:Arf-GAP domain-containing protein n=1 Tax=Naumovozyma dairenensis (strain ATCC 10597 / BCRC 20456 / CBS 421 / NBRC 0211 / NRRL Y-12639) TaxID=1071378 RepID=G0W3N3_NAUDC|nr:hypothetical protein NDAI_0A02630 [Naumovozyma dairenensis CBS 421]CCD22421.1 hypothetical protein NDAI_0A02630 [Naumovozyma dairenensis CBS 421]